MTKRKRHTPEQIVRLSGPRLVVQALCELGLVLVGPGFTELGWGE